MYLFVGLLVGLKPSPTGHSAMVPKVRALPTLGHPKPKKKKKTPMYPRERGGTIAPGCQKATAGDHISTRGLYTPTSVCASQCRRGCRNIVRG